jgi:hypothetical protein
VLKLQRKKGVKVYKKLKQAQNSGDSLPNSGP